jgi:hypothetical protein
MRTYNLQVNHGNGKGWGNVLRMECTRKLAEDEMTEYCACNPGSRFRLVVVKP